MNQPQKKAKSEAKSSVTQCVAKWLPIFSQTPRPTPWIRAQPPPLQSNGLPAFDDPRRAIPFPDSYWPNPMSNELQGQKNSPKIVMDYESRVREEIQRFKGFNVDFGAQQIKYNEIKGILLLFVHEIDKWDEIDLVANFEGQTKLESQFRKAIGTMFEHVGIFLNQTLTHFPVGTPVDLIQLDRVNDEALPFNLDENQKWHTGVSVKARKFGNQPGSDIANFPRVNLSFKYVHFVCRDNPGVIILVPLQASTYVVNQATFAPGESSFLPLHSLADVQLFKLQFINNCKDPLVRVVRNISFLWMLMNSAKLIEQLVTRATIDVCAKQGLRFEGAHGGKTKVVTGPECGPDAYLYGEAVDFATSHMRSGVLFDSLISTNAGEPISSSFYVQNKLEAQYLCQLQPESLLIVTARDYTLTTFCDKLSREQKSDWNIVEYISQLKEAKEHVVLFFYRAGFLHHQRYIENIESLSVSTRGFLRTGFLADEIFRSPKTTSIQQVQYVLQPGVGQHINGYQVMARMAALQRARVFFEGRGSQRILIDLKCDQVTGDAVLTIADKHIKIITTSVNISDAMTVGATDSFRQRLTGANFVLCVMCQHDRERYFMIPIYDFSFLLETARVNSTSRHQAVLTVTARDFVLDCEIIFDSNGARYKYEGAQTTRPYDINTPLPLPVPPRSRLHDIIMEKDNAKMNLIHGRASTSKFALCLRRVLDVHKFKIQLDDVLQTAHVEVILKEVSIVFDRLVDGAHRHPALILPFFSRMTKWKNKKLHPSYHLTEGAHIHQRIRDNLDLDLQCLILVQVNAPSLIFCIYGLRRIKSFVMLFNPCKRQALEAYNIRAHDDLQGYRIIMESVPKSA